MPIDPVTGAFILSAGTKLATSIGQGKNIDRQVKLAKAAARERFDPGALTPTVELFRERAAEGVPEGIENIQRAKAVERLFRPQELEIFGGNQARAIAGAEAQNIASQQAFGEFERGLSEAEISARLQGEQQLAQAESQVRQIESQREAAIKEAELMGEAEKQRRRQAGTAAAIGTFSTLATTPFGEDGQTALGTLFGDGQEQAANVGEQLAETARAGVDVDVEDTIIEDPLSQEQLNLGRNTIQGAAQLNLPKQGPVVEAFSEEPTPEFDEQALVEEAQKGEDIYGLRKFFASQAGEGESPVDVVNRLFTSGDEQALSEGEPTVSPRDISRAYLGEFGEAAFDVSQFGRGLAEYPSELFGMFSDEYQKALEIARKEQGF